MTDETDETDKDQRIAELEQELARLRQDRDVAQLDSWAATSPVDAAAPSADDLAETDGDLKQHLPSRRRAIILAVAVGFVALAAIVAIVMGLSSIIQPLSREAAGALSPFEPGSVAPAKAAPDPIRAPGL